jgi:hypothetical protein
VVVIRKSSKHFPHVEDEASHDNVPDAVLDGPMLDDQLRQLQCPVVALVQSRSRRGRFGTSGGRCDVCEGAAEPGQPRLQTGRDYRGIEQNQGGGEQQLVFGDVFVVFVVADLHRQCERRIVG